MKPAMLFPRLIVSAQRPMYMRMEIPRMWKFAVFVSCATHTVVSFMHDDLVMKSQNKSDAHRGSE